MNLLKPSTTVQKSSRIEVLDALRGFALAGILITHFLHFYYYNLIPLRVTQVYFVNLNKLILNLDFKLIDNKFYTIFSFLFGLSFAIQKEAFQSKIGSFRIWAMKRMIILTLIGFFHHIIWKGDNLLILGLSGFLLVFLSKLPNYWILIIAFIGIMGTPTQIYEVIQSNQSTRFENIFSEKNMKSQEVFFQLEKKGTVFQNFSSNFYSFGQVIRYWFLSSRIWITLGSVLIGYYVGMGHLFKNFIDHKSSFKRLFILVTLLFITLTMIKLSSNSNLEDLFYSRWYFVLDSILDYIQNLVFSFWYIIVFCYLYYFDFFRKFLKLFIPVGKTALSNYLFQSFIGLTVFYGFGFGLFLKIPEWLNLLLALLTFSVEIIVSSYWLRNHKQGPVEWAWRNLANRSWKGLGI